MTKLEKKERAKIKREGRHMAAEMIVQMHKIKNVNDMMDNYYSLVSIIKEELESIIIKLGYCIKKDVEYAIKLAIEHTYKYCNRRKYKDYCKHIPNATVLLEETDTISTKPTCYRYQHYKLFIQSINDLTKKISFIFIHKYHSKG